MPKDQLRTIEEEFLKEFDIIEDKIVAPKVLEFLKKHIEAAYEEGKEKAWREASLEIHTACKKAAEDIKRKVVSILGEEVLLAHTTTSGKTSLLTSAINRVIALPVQSKE